METFCNWLIERNTTPKQLNFVELYCIFELLSLLLRISLLYFSEQLIIKIRTTDSLMQHLSVVAKEGLFEKQYKCLLTTCKCNL